MSRLVLRDEVESHTGIIVAVWLIFALATVALCGKLLARYRRFKRLYWDDFWVILAWAHAIPLAISTAISQQNQAKLDDAPTASVFLSRPIGQLFFYNALWAVKISFLVFFRRLIPIPLTRLRTYWAVVLAITIITCAGVWGVNPYKCWIKKGVNECQSDPSVVKSRPISLAVATGLIAMTDGLILVIPFVILSKIKKISQRKQVILYGLFSIQMITIAVSVIRCVFATTSLKVDKNFRLTWLGFLAHLEADIAIVVACVGSLRSLFTQDDASRRSPYPTSNEQFSQGNKKRHSSPQSRARIQLRSFNSRAYENKDSMELPLASIPVPPAR